MAVVTWSPTDKHSTVNLSNGNLTAQLTSTGGIPRTTEGKSTGKWYWEIKLDQLTSWSLGMCTGAFALTGDTSTALGYSNAGVFAWYAGSTQSTMNGVGYTKARGSMALNDVIGFAVDLDSNPNTIRYFKNGVEMGTAETITFATRPLYPTAQKADGGIFNITANFGASAFAYTPPSGYQSYGTAPMDALTKRTTLNSMAVGDYIECEYVASSGAVGVFSNLGAATKALIPASGTLAPNGKFNFICVERKAGKGGLLIADRYVQNTINWDTLNNAGLIEGKALDIAKGLPVVFTGFTVVGGTGILTDGSIPVSSSYAYGPNVGSGGTDTTATVVLDLGSLKNVGGVRAIFCTDVYYQYSTSAEVHYSTDGINYTLYGTITHPGQPTGFDSCVPVGASNVTARYIKLKNFKAASYARATINELEVLGGDILIRSLSGGCAYADSPSLVPVMTSDTAPSGVVTYSDQYQSTLPYCAWCAFDSTLFGENGWVSADAGLTHWLAYEFPIATLVDRYTINSYNDVTTYFFKTWKFQGSNDGTTWVDLDSQVNYTFTPNTPYPFDINNTIAYKRYRIYITATSAPNTRMVLPHLSLQKKVNAVPSTTNKGLGAFPVNNEWDTHIVKSTLGGKITAGDDGIWHWSGSMSCITRDTIAISIAANIRRVFRGGSSLSLFSQDQASTAHAIYGFRPVLEFAEDGTIFY